MVQSMKTVRFSNLVDSSGKPDTYLLFVEPEDDRTFQKAVKSKRVVTVFQNASGNKTDHGEVGFAPGPSRQYLVFPKSVGAFDGRKVVGIKYDLLESAPIPKSKRADRPSPPPKRRPVRAKVEKAKKTTFEPEEKAREEREKELEASRKVVKFPKPAAEEPEEDDEESEAIEEMKAQVRKAMGELEKGKQVAAFNLLKRIVGD